MKSEKNYEEQYLRGRIVDIAIRNRNYTEEFSKIIIGHLNKDDTVYKCRLFDIIDLLLKEPPTGKDYINKLSGHLYLSFKECFTWSEFEDRVLLFKIFYTWKYLIPPDIFKKIREDNKIDDFKEMFIKKYPGKIEKYDEYNEKNRLSLLNSRNNNNNNTPVNVRHEQASHKDIKINLNKFNNSNNISNNNTHKNNPNPAVNKKIIIEKKKFEEDNIPNSNPNSNPNDNQPKINIGTKTKSKKEAMTGKKRKSSHEKSTDGNISTKKKKSIDPMKNMMNQNMNNTSFINVNNKRNVNINENEIIPTPNSLNNSNTLNLLFGAGMNYSNLFMQNQQQIQQQENQQHQQQLIKNLFAMMNQQVLQSPNPNQISLREYQIFNFITNTNVKLNTNLRFFSALAKYYNDSLVESNKIEIKYKYEDIYFNKEYQTIRDKVDSKLFNDIKKNVCAICGFRTLFYNNLTEHLDIHFNINYLQIEGKNLLRKIGHNRNNWITGDINIKNAKNKVGHTLGNLIYYKNMSNNNFIKIKNEQEEVNEELMYPVDEEVKEVCYYCGDEFKKVLSILNTNLRQGPKQRYSTYMNKRQATSKQYRRCGKGVYVTPDIAKAETYAHKTKIGNLNKEFQFAVMVRCDPNKIRDPGVFPVNWVLNGNNNEIRPYRLLYKLNS